jgi:uncharacterized protein YlxW (UPF0749 family)
MLQGPTPMPGDFIPLMGMLTGVVAMLMVGFTVIRVAQSQIGQAIARRIHGKGAADPELREEVYQLREQVTALEHRLAESEERLDFTERLLSRGSQEARPNG